MKDENVEIKVITPEEANQLLARNRKNRPFSRRRAEWLSDLIQRGEWAFNGDMIRISKTGRLLDGQHRLSAIVRSGTPVRVGIVTDLPDDVFDLIDTGGRQRTAGDVLYMKGEQYYISVAAVARMAHIYFSTGNPVHGAPQHNPSVRQIESIIDRHPEIRESVKAIGRTNWCKKYLQMRIGGFCHWVFHRDDADAAEPFFEILEHGNTSTRGSPAILLRDRLMEDRANKARLGDYYKVALIFKAFRLFKNDSTVKFLRIRTVGDGAEHNPFSL